MCGAIAPLAAEILERARAAGIDRDCGIAPGDETAPALQKLDGFLCELKELQIRDGLHVLGTSPDGERLDALLRRDRPGAARRRRTEDESLLRALAADLDLGADPLMLDLAEPWTGPRPAALARRRRAVAHCRRHGRAAGGAGAAARLGRRRPPAPEWQQHPRRARLDRARIAAGGGGVRRGRDRGGAGRARRRRVEPGPTGAPSRGRPEVLPTGRNFYSVDTRAVPTPAAWQLGWHSAALLVERHAQEHGNYPARLALSAWGTANMRTGGDDIAQALALIGVRPVWEGASGRVTGFEILPASVLDRPRVDVTLRISGFFRDAFPGLIDLFDSAVRAVAALDEPPATNPLAARVAADRQRARSRRGRRPTRPSAAPAIGSSARSRGPTAPVCRP